VFCVRVDVGFGRREQILSEHRLRYRRDSDATDAKSSTRVLAVPTMASHRKSPAATSGCGVRFGLLQTQHCLLSSGQCSSSRYTNVSSSCPFSLHFLLFLFPSADIPPNTTRTDFPFVRVFFTGTAATGFMNGGSGHTSAGSTHPRTDKCTQRYHFFSRSKQRSQ
jgi:hypothetical protein